MMKTLLLTLTLTVSVYAATDVMQNPSYSFEDYLAEFSKAYPTSAQLLHRAKIFEANLEQIRAQNSFTGATWTAGLNEFTDWSNEEFKAQRTGTKKPIASELYRAPLLNAAATADSSLPSSVDWRDTLVTPIKNQGGCGSCWAFSATETLESSIAKATGKLLVLAPQQIVSCTPDPDDCGGTGGCKGATQQLGYNYTIAAGISAETSYPYQGVTGKCDPTKVKPVAGIKGYVTVTPNNYTALATAVATEGPIAITVAAGSWQLYSHGIFNGGLSGSCGFELDHGVQLVGYGSTATAGRQLLGGGGTGDYWIVRNSWGPGWGEKGYMRLARFGEGKEPCGVDKAPADGIACKGNTTQVTYCGECGILSSSSYPTGAYLK